MQKGEGEGDGKQCGATVIQTAFTHLLQARSSTGARGRTGGSGLATRAGAGRRSGEGEETKSGRRRAEERQTGASPSFPLCCRHALHHCLSFPLQLPGSSCVCPLLSIEHHVATALQSKGGAVLLLVHFPSPLFTKPPSTDRITPVGRTHTHTPACPHYSPFTPAQRHPARMLLKVRDRRQRPLLPLRRPSLVDAALRAAVSGAHLRRTPPAHTAGSALFKRETDAAEEATNAAAAR